MDTQTAESNYTYIEVQTILNSLSEANIARLLQIYSVMGCEQRAGLASRDVFHDVTCKVLAMERAWPREVDPLAFLVETGRSVISNEEKKYVREVVTDPEEMDRDKIDPQTSEPWMEDAVPAPDVQVVLSQSNTKLDEWVKKVQELFADDEDATCFITKKLSELKKAAILLACKFTDQTYRNVEKRIKDKVRKRFPKGLPWWEIEL